MPTNTKMKKCRLGENLDFLLKKHEIDIKNLAMAIGVPASTIARIRRQGNPTVATLEPLLDFFRVDMDSLLYADMSHQAYQAKIRSGKLTHIPVFELADVKRDRKVWASSKVSQFVGASGITGKHVFGIHIRTQSLAPAFCNNSIAILDPDLEPREGDYVLCYLDDEAPVFRQIFIDGNQRFFKPVNPGFGDMQAHKKFKIAGVIIKSIESYR